MIAVDNIKTTLRDIFLEAIGFDPFMNDVDYHKSIGYRFALDKWDIIELVVRMEIKFNITITYSQDDDVKIMMMNIDELVKFITLKVKA